MPLFPLSLKIDFWEFGKQPLAPIVVASAGPEWHSHFGGWRLEVSAGNAAGAPSLLVVTLGPSLVSCEHFFSLKQNVFSSWRG